MFAGELRKQKFLFAAIDSVALIIAFAAALLLHDPGAAMQHKLLAADWSMVLPEAAVVVMLCRSVPAPGSDRHRPARFSARANIGRYLRF